MMDKTAEEISLQEIAESLWSRRLLILVLTSAFTGIAITIAFLLPTKYAASVVLAPVSEDADGGKLGGAGGLLSQFGGLAALGGLSIGESGKKAESVATLQSHALTETFIKEKNLLPVLYESKWDNENQEWKPTRNSKVPTFWKGEDYFRRKVRSVSEDKKTSLVTLTVTWKDPELAATWANELVMRTNHYLRDRALEQSRKNLDYLKDQLTKTSVLELQKSIYSLIEVEIKKVMIANGNDEYAFRIIDPARVPEERSSPKRALIIAVGLSAGLMIGLILALVLPRNQTHPAR